ncbi:MAG: segregation/condensation protein A [Cyanobacteria bacterium J06642_2]
MTASLADEAIAFIIDLAERGDIDPWDVPVIDVIDRFLERLAPTANTSDLSESGQAFLYASMLVYFKAVALAASEEEEDEFPEGFETDEEFEGGHRLGPVSLDTVLRPRPVARISRTRPVTLKELIQHLQAIEDSVREQAQRPVPEPKTRQPRQSRSERLAAIKTLAHPENLSEMVAVLEPLLAHAWHHNTELDFEELAKQAEASSSDMASRVSTFWALLLMASRSQVELSQNEFYIDLTISPGTTPIVLETPPQPRLERVSA